MPTSSTVTFNQIVAAMSILDEMLPLITGLNEWREETEQFSLYDIAPDMRKHAVVPASKQQAGSKQGLWSHIHMGLMMPAIKNIVNTANTYDALKETHLPIEDAATYFSSLPALLKHIKQRKEVTDTELEAIINRFPERRDETMLGEFATDLQAVIPKNAYSPAENNMIGRLIQAKLAIDAEHPTYLAQIGLNTRIIKYLANSNKSLFERTQTYFMKKIPECPLYDVDWETYNEITCADIFELYGWFAHEDVVEMIEPGLQGAAQTVAKEINAYLTFTSNTLQINLQNHKPDASLLNNEAFIYDLGLIAALTDMIKGDNAGEPLRTLAKALSSDETRLAVWGNMTSYDLKKNQSNEKLFAAAPRLMPWGRYLIFRYKQLRGLISPEPYPELEI